MLWWLVFTFSKTRTFPLSTPPPIRSPHGSPLFRLRLISTISFGIAFMLCVSFYLKNALSNKTYDIVLSISNWQKTDEHTLCALLPVSFSSYNTLTYIWRSRMEILFETKDIIFRSCLDTFQEVSLLKSIGGYLSFSTKIVVCTAYYYLGLKGCKKTP